MDTIITSASNPTIKMIRRLISSAKARRDDNMYVAEGIHLASSYMSSGAKPRLLAYAVAAEDNKEVAELVNQAVGADVEVMTIANGLFESISTVHAAVGVLVLFTPSSNDQPIAPLDESAVILEAVQDPGNLGTILRTAVAVGTKKALLSPGCASPWSPKALRAGMGAQFGLTVYEEQDLASAAKTATVPLLTTSLSPDSVSLYDTDLKGAGAWIFGNEGQGVSKPLAELASTRILIPQVDSTVESLNVAAAAAVCLYEQYRQNNS